MTTTQRSEKGFTIIELLIATVTFSLILLVITAAIIQFSRVYYKGVATAKTQDTARTIADEITKNAQFTRGSITGSTLPGGVKQVCVGSTQYKYTLNSMTTNALIASQPCGISVSERNLLGDNMRLLQLDVTETAGVAGLPPTVEVKVTVGYGSDVIIDATDPSKSNCPTILRGGQFCAVSSVKTSVTKRL